MGSLGPTHLISLLLVVAIIAATGGLFASAVARRNQRRARGFFVLGFFCGFMLCAILRGRRRGLKALGTIGRWAHVSPPRVGLLCDTYRFAARMSTSRLPRGYRPSLGATRTIMVKALMQRIGVAAPTSLARPRRGSG